jgi:hypothetical protein
MGTGIAFWQDLPMQPDHTIGICHRNTYIRKRGKTYAVYALQLASVVASTSLVTVWDVAKTASRIQMNLLSGLCLVLEAFQSQLTDDQLMTTAYPRVIPIITIILYFHLIPLFLL